MPNSTNLFRPDTPNALERFLSSPTLFLARWFYTHRPPLLPPSQGSPPIRIICISDTHNKTPILPAGDILIHAGDLCINGEREELEAQIEWLNSLDFKHKIVIAGNHDVCLTATTSTTSNNQENDRIDWGSITYLENTSTVLYVRGRRLKIYGSPYTPRYGNWAFQYPPHFASSTWANTVPSDTDILLTHAPARGHLDSSLGWPNQGCRELLREVRRVRPRVHVCGHVHGGRGREVVEWGGGVQDCYERIMAGEGGWRILGGMICGSGLEWTSWCLGRRRVGTGEVVNAAMREDGEGRGRMGLLLRYRKPCRSVRLFCQVIRPSRRGAGIVGHDWK